MAAIQEEFQNVVLNEDGKIMTRSHRRSKKPLKYASPQPEPIITIKEEVIDDTDPDFGGSVSKLPKKSP
ncbi:unnamed protein product [Caenorhabditis auriculariae]|uniref:Uncharacterized protein n=1 Tax=Caenorhabditis auriculariae TaxID=2777116 RepID=A0A8S1H2F9_9PELO|nr:unnamed protein product [Caenorhabditis auriculariae]